MTLAADPWIEAMDSGAEPCAALVHSDREACGRLGGLPTIGGVHAWPVIDGRPLSFLAELDLGAVSAAYPAPWLPTGGKLHFFYDLVRWPAGYDPADRGGWAVLHTPPGAAALPVAPPEGLDADDAFRLTPLAAVAAISRPDPLLYDGQIGWLSDLPDEEWRRVNDHRDFQAHYPRHQVGGHPSPIQEADIGRECALAAGGIRLDGPEAYAAPEADALSAQAGEWKLLLQLDSDERAGMMWSDVGTLYFMIREADARAGDFSRAWLILQSS